MSTGLELIPLLIGGGIWTAGYVAKQVGEAVKAARVAADEAQQAHEEVTVAFETAMRDLPLATQALEASGITITSTTGTAVEMDVDGRCASLVQSEDGTVQLHAPLAMGEEAITQLASDLDIEYRKLVQAESYRRVVEQAREHGLGFAHEVVEEDGSITITLNA